MNKKTLAPGIEYSNEVVLYTGNFVTVNKEQPKATAVVVKSGVIEFVGTKEQAETHLANQNLDYRVDEQFSTKTIVPGFIEAHMHPLMAALFTGLFEYGGQYERVGVAGKTLKAATNAQELKARLLEVKEAHDDAGKTGQWINMWGLDPLLLTDGTRVDRDFIDSVISDSPVFFMHASVHIASMNSMAVELAGYTTNDDANFVFQENGRVTGEIAEMKDLYRALNKGAFNFAENPEMVPYCLMEYAKIANSLGVTTVSDCGMGIPIDPVQLYQALSTNPDFKLRVTSYPLIGTYDLEKANALKELDNDRFCVGNVKFVNTDGSIQGFTANLREDFQYYNGKPNTPLTRTIESIYDDVVPFHKAGYSISFHCNGNGTTEILIDLVTRLQKEAPMPHVRHCLEHNQMVTDDQLVRMKELGMVHNLFGTHIPVWGDVHATQTVGPELVKRLNPFQSSIKHDVPFSIHCDDGVTQVNPLFMMWGATNRQCIFSGNVYGEEECLTAEQALHAVTLGAAYLMGHEDNKGSIAIGKLADLAILEQNPLEVPKQHLKDIKVHATMLGGDITVHQEVATTSSEEAVA